MAERSIFVISSSHRSENRTEPFRKTDGRPQQSMQDSPPRRSHHTSSTGSGGLAAAAQQPPIINPPGQQSISLIAGDEPPRIIRRIMDPTEVKLPRRTGEGARPIFDREELRDAMIRRQRMDDNEQNPPLAVPVQEPPQTQRVIAIIREPIGANSLDGYRDLSKQEPLAASSSYSSSRRSPSRHHHPRAISPEPLRPSAISGSKTTLNYRRSITPPLVASGRSALQTRRSPPRDDRSIERKRDAYERERGRVDVDLRETVREPEVRGGAGRSRSRDRNDRFGPSSSNALGTRPRSRSPIRIPRERRSRSRSHTPPPMPPEIRRQLMLERDLRSKLSRPLTKALPNKYESDVSEVSFYILLISWFWYSKRIWIFET
jgi:hypothetical protein